jgi:iron complex outermembrane receptor protein
MKWWLVFLVLAPQAAFAAAPSDTLSHIVTLPGVEVSTARGDSVTPVARSVLNREDIKRVNWGQDTPMALSLLPGAYAYSDAGNGIGYSYLYLRGFPQQRISVLLDGVPLNDPESHQVYWIDHPDLLASTDEAQVQRGVGSAIYGAASVGGSVNLETGPFRDTPGATAVYSYGSYETSRLMAEGNSGDLSGGWQFYGRYSRIRTEGYRDGAYSRLWSYYFGAQKLTGAHSFRMLLFGGPEETKLSYLGIPQSTLDGGLTGNPDVDRRFNPLTYPNERDHFFEPHYELIHTWAPKPTLTFTQTIFYFDGSGYYDEQRLGQNLTDYRLTPWTTTDSTLFSRDHYAQNPDGSLTQDAQGRFTVDKFDVVRRRFIADRHYGWVPRVKLDHAHGALTLGGEIRRHDGHHTGDVLSGNGLPPDTPADAPYYDYHPWTLSAGLFAREEWNAAHNWLVTADLGWRHQGYYMRDDQFDGIRFDQTYDFLNPRLGVTWTATPRVTAFASYAHASREPAFQDLYDGETVGNLPLYGTIDVAAGIYENPLIHPEHVDDFEAGARWNGNGTSASANLFRMNFRDELVYAGQFNTDLGYPILGNAARSIHQGLELEARGVHQVARDTRVSLFGNATLSDNHFVDYREIDGTAPGDTVFYNGKTLGFFPNILANLGGRWEWKKMGLGASLQHVGRIYLDNTETTASSISPHTVINLDAAYRIQKIELTFQAFNVGNLKYSTSGYMDYDSAGNYVPMFIPAATRNVLAQVRFDY